MCVTAVSEAVRGKTQTNIRKLPELKTGLRFWVTEALGCLTEEMKKAVYPYPMSLFQK